MEQDTEINSIYFFSVLCSTSVVNLHHKFEPCDRLHGNPCTLRALTPVVFASMTYFIREHIAIKYWMDS